MEDSGDPVPRAERIARQFLDHIERSGYGTDQPFRYTPTFSVEEVRALCEAVLNGGTTHD